MSFGGLAVVSTTDCWFSQFHLHDLSLMIKSHHFGVGRLLIDYFFRYNLILTNGIFHGIIKISKVYQLYSHNIYNNIFSMFFTNVQHLLCQIQIRNDVIFFLTTRW